MIQFPRLLHRVLMQGKQFLNQLEIPHSLEGKVHSNLMKITWNRESW